MTIVLELIRNDYRSLQHGNKHVGGAPLRTILAEENRILDLLRRTQ